MTSDRLQRRLERLLDEAEQALDCEDWRRVRAAARGVLDLDPSNNDAQVFMEIAERRQRQVAGEPGEQLQPASVPSGFASSPKSEPTSFANGRYAVKRFLGEGGKKRVYLAHDTLLDRDVAFALIKTEGLDDVGRDRISREAKAMGRLGAHPHIVSVFDLGEENGQPYIVTELMDGGDVEVLIEKAPEQRPPLERTVVVGIEVCRGLEFAHSHGIIHRDLKPGNVWLAADGTAKLGDFGLAVALDKSRLTQAGMMVGTVSYMPPEQAMGGEVTPRSDLYSLGAMLYEMVTGRPPFVGDESVAVITQHLNVQPVAPSWHNALVPSAMEGLILQLMEKDPGKRPGTAAEVREALEGILATESNAPPEPSEAAAAADNPMYRRSFVGRETELHQLQAAYDAAVSGQGGLVMVVGEPGIGKTSLTEQTTTYATIRGGRTLIGHCYEEGSLSLPYLPFVEALRSYVLARDPEGLRQDLGTGAGEVARIVSEIRDRLNVELPPTGALEDDRWRLLQAVTSFVRSASTVQPLVIVVEDLHDADRGTLDLLLHLARNLQGSRLLIVGTYRDVEVDRAHPLSSTLAELRRSQNFLRIPLRGLTADEVQRMMSAVSQQDIPWPFAELVHRQTEGNPLFVQEMLRYLVEEGLVERRQGALRRVGDETLAGRIPEGLRDVIGKRLSRLSDRANEVLSVASVLGREFRLDALQRVAALSEEDLYTALEEATALAVVEQRQAVGTVGFRFMHAFFRQTLYEEIFVPRRIRLHQNVGRALEEIYGRRLEEHAAELAEHFAQSTEGEDLEKALHYCQLAASRAMSVYAYGEAARHLEQALKVQEVLDPDDKAKRCDLLCDLGAALLPAGEPGRVVDAIAPEALALAQDLSDRGRASRPCQLAIEAIRMESGPAGRSSARAREWAEVADRYADPGTLDRVYADVALFNPAYFAGRQTEAWNLCQRAIGLAHELGNVQAEYRAAGSLVAQVWAPEFQTEKLRLLAEFSERRPSRMSPGDAVWLWAEERAFLQSGELQRSAEAREQLRVIAEQTRDPSDRMRYQHSVPVHLLIAGRLEEAAAAAQDLKRLGADLGIPGPAATQAFNEGLRPLAYLGRAEEAVASQPEVARRAVEQNRSLVFAADRALCLAHAGRLDDARILVDLLRTGWKSSEPGGGLSLFPLTNYFEVAILLKDEDLVERIYQRLVFASDLLTPTAVTVIARHLGAARVVLGDWEVARVHYDQALKIAARVQFRPETALIRLGLAELLLEDYPDRRAEALAHLDFAIGEFREMKMQPSLERALRHKELLKA
jgi:hypothetical protein